MTTPPEHDWTGFWKDLAANWRTDPRHEVAPPVESWRLRAVVASLGPMPAPLKSMLEAMNGAVVYDELFTLFGVSGGSENLELYDWYVDAFTEAWRARNMIGRTDWVFGVFSYGAVVVMHSDGACSEWESATQSWADDFRLRDLPKRIAEEGEQLEG